MATIYTDVGENVTADYFDGTSSAPANYYVAWGTGTGTASKTDTTLFTEASETRVTPTTEDQPSSNQNRWIATLTADGSKTITNAGLFDALTGGNMVIKGDFTGIALTASDKIEFTITLTWS
jgi:hypothetical protein